MLKGKFNYKILFSFLILMIGISSTMSAQFKVYGTIKTAKKKYHGEVITYEPQEYVTMNCQGDTLTWDITPDTKFSFTTRKPPKKYNFPLGIGYHRISMGLLFGNPKEGVSLSYQYTHQKSLRVGYGGGLSFENYGSEEGYDFIVPRATYVGYLKETNATPFWQVDAGYGIAIKNEGKGQTDATGGFNLGIGVGYRLSTNKVMVDFLIGVRLQKATYRFDKIDFVRKENNLFQRTQIGIGFMW